MPNKYVLWRVSNGWLMTYGTTIWEDWERRQVFAVFHSLKEFSDWVEKKEPKTKPQPNPRIHGKVATAKPINRIATNAGRATANS